MRLIKAVDIIKNLMLRTIEMLLFCVCNINVYYIAIGHGKPLCIISIKSGVSARKEIKAIEFGKKKTKKA